MDSMTIDMLMTGLAFGSGIADYTHDLRFGFTIAVGTYPLLDTLRAIIDRKT